MFVRISAVVLGDPAGTLTPIPGGGLLTELRARRDAGPRCIARRRDDPIVRMSMTCAGPPNSYPAVTAEIEVVSRNRTRKDRV